MKTIKLTLIIVLLALSLNLAQTNWSADNSHSRIGFSVTHLVISEVDGFFKTYDLKVTTDGDDFGTAKIDFTADVASIFTDNEKRDKHLKSEDFFNAEIFPQIIFKSKSIEKVGENKYKLTGDFTMRGVTKEIELDVKFNGIITDPWGNTKAGLKLSGEINRFDYGLKWNATMEAGGLVVSQDVELKINLELKKLVK